jgi:hypothetical protein
MAEPVDYLGGLQESVKNLNRDLSEPGVREGITRLGDTLGLAEDIILAALYREARRNGYTLKLMIEELERQVEQVKKRQATG